MSRSYCEPFTDGLAFPWFEPPSQPASPASNQPAGAVLRVVFLFAFMALQTGVVYGQFQMENINRGVVAVRTGSSQVYIGWRMFGTDPSGIGFNVYRGTTKLNSAPITNSTNYVDNTSTNSTYRVTPVINGVEQASSESVDVWSQQYLEVPLQIPPGGTVNGESYTYSANDCSVGDLDGDGQYEIVVKWDPSNAKDNAQSGYTGNVFIDAYKLNGTRIWRIDMGRNIRAGAHYTQFMVYDLDGDGRAEVACKTADATRDGQGAVIGNANADHRNSSGYVLSGPEFLTIFEGTTGRALATANYVPARGTVSSWGDNYGNRVDRFTAAVAYLDGQRPSLVMGRGYYTRMVRAAWDWRNGQLTNRWTFDNNSSYSGQGNHQMTVGDADSDGRQEIFNGSSAINDNGTGFWTNGRGHGDALHMSDMDPDRPGLEIWMPYECMSCSGNVGAALIDANTGSLIWTRPGTGDVGRANAADIDPNHKGYEVWAAGATGGVFNIKGTQLSTSRPSINFSVWWDDDLQRELIDGTTISKWNPSTGSAASIFSPSGMASNNGTKATPALTADLFGDWREEVIWRTASSNALRIYTTTISTSTRIYTLMHDPQYRMAVAWQNAAYNQPPHPGFYLGGGMNTPPTPNIVLVGGGNNCQPTAVTPYLQIDGGSWSQATTASVSAGVTVKFGPQPVSGGSWSWTGPNGFSATTREVTLTNIQTGQAGSYVATHTNSCGSPSTATFTVVVSGSGNGSVTIQESATGFCGVDGTIDSNNAGYTGPGFANTNNASGTGVSWQVSTSGGSHTIAWRYANGGGSDRSARLLVNGSTVLSGISFPATSDWTTWAEVVSTVTLGSGANTIRLEATGSAGLGNIDYIQLTGPGTPTTIACNGNARTEITLPAEGAVSVEEELRAVPNPVDGNMVEIRANLNVRTPVRIRMTDLLGREVYGADLGQQEVGELRHSIDITATGRGTYIVKLSTGTGFRFVKVMRK